MKTLCFDTSSLFRIYSGEPGHHEVKGLLPGGDPVASAWHARAEFAAIILRKKREAPAPAKAFDEVHQQFLDEHRDGHIEFLRLDEGVMERLEAVLRSASADTFVRAADALHLACAAEHRFTEVLSNDRHLLAAAPLFGLTARDVIV